MARAKQWKGKTIKSISEERVVFRDKYVHECEELDAMIDTYNSNCTQLEEERARVEEERIELEEERTRLEEDRRTAEQAAAETKRTGSSDDAAPPIVEESGDLQEDHFPSSDNMVFRGRGEEWGVTGG